MPLNHLSLNHQFLSRSVLGPSLARLAMVSIVALPFSGCGSLSDAEEQDLNNYKYNSKLYYERGDFIRAEMQCRKGLALEEDDVSLNPLLGYALLRQQSLAKVKQAETHFEHICDSGLYPREYIPRLGLASSQHWLALQTKDVAQRRQYIELAEANLERVRELNKESIEASLLLAQIRALGQSYGPALLSLNEGLEQLENQAKLWTRVSDADKSERRRPDIDLDIRVNNARQKEFRALKANILHNQERYDEALVEFDAIEKLGSMKSHDIYNLARLLEDAGQNKKAVEQYDRFLKVSNSVDGFVREVIRRKAKLQVEVENDERRE